LHPSTTAQSSPRTTGREHHGRSLPGGTQTTLQRAARRDGQWRRGRDDQGHHRRGAITAAGIGGSIATARALSGTVLAGMTATLLWSWRRRTARICSGRSGDGADRAHVGAHKTIQNWGKTEKIMGSVESRNPCCRLIYGVKTKKARPPTRGPGTARENDACS
jgi:hypothetical protein